MKIAIANSLLEPVGIPWFKSQGECHVLGVRDDLHERFDAWKRTGWLPSSTDYLKYDHKDVRYLLKLMVVNKGGKQVMVSSGRLYKNHKWIADRFTVIFSEPGKETRHRVLLDDFFK